MHLQSKFESSLGTGLDGVRIHRNARSAAAADSIGARAYTVGNDIHFNKGEYDPDSPRGQTLLAHEVVHAVQQAGIARQVQPKLQVSEPGDSLEREADEAATAIMQGRPAQVTAAAGIARKVIQRKDDDKKPPQESNSSAEDAAKWQQFINKCSRANSYLNQAYSAAAAFVYLCSNNYNAGYKAHEAALQAWKDRMKLTQDLILGVIFAAVGGAAGGAVGIGVGKLLGDMAKTVVGGGDHRCCQGHRQVRRKAGFAPRWWQQGPLGRQRDRYAG